MKIETNNPFFEMTDSEFLDFLDEMGVNYRHVPGKEGRIVFEDDLLTAVETSTVKIKSHDKCFKDITLSLSLAA